MSSIGNFYDNLLSIEVAIFGIIAATILVFVQIIHGKFSHKEVHVIYNFYFRLYLLLSFSTLLATTIGTYCLAYEYSCQPIRYVFLHHYVGLLILVFIAFSLFLFFNFIRSNFTYLKPSRIALLIGENVTISKIFTYLLKEYGIPSESQVSFYTLIGMANQGDIELTPEEEAARHIIHDSTLNEYEKQRQLINTATDPFERLDYLLIDSIKAKDISALDECLRIFDHHSKQFIQEFNYRHDKNDLILKHDALVKFIQYITTKYWSFLQICEKERLDVVTLRILEQNRLLINALIANDCFTEIGPALEIWKNKANEEIPFKSKVFHRIVDLYRILIDETAEGGTHDDKILLDSLFVHLGWIGEMVLLKIGFEKKPLMNTGYETLHDKVFGILSRYKDTYFNNSANFSIAFFDAIKFIAIQLININKVERDKSIEDDIERCAFIFGEFVIHALKANNIELSESAVLKIIDLYNQAKEHGWTELASCILEFLANTGALTAVQENGDETILSDYIFKKIIEIHPETEFIGCLDSLQREHFHPGDKLGHLYIKKLKKALGRES